jgi:hypothetical protein
VALGLAAATFCGAWPVAAQNPAAGRQGPVWTLEGLRAGQCVRFLMDPHSVAKHVREGARLFRADRFELLHPALRSVIESQPEFASWVPSSLCLFYVDAVRLGGRRYGNKDPRKRQMVGVWTVAASEQASGARRDLVLEFFGTNADLVRAAGLAKVKFKAAHSAVSKATGTDSDLHEIRIGRTRLVWNGRAAGDSTRVEQAIEESWLAKGTSGGLWAVQATLEPAWSRPLVGVLSVEGKDDLAKALKASPTRFVGPVFYGGGGELSFSS